MNFCGGKVGYIVLKCNHFDVRMHARHCIRSDKTLVSKVELIYVAMHSQATERTMQLDIIFLI